MSISPLKPELTRAALDHLGMAGGQPRPDLPLLDALLAAYTRTVPWESAFRIAKRARTDDTADCPRWPEEFWLDAITRGGGGTCFESNYAFFSLLRALGYEGYLTINDMGESIGCHSAIVLTIDGQRWLADVGLPTYAALPLDSQAVTQRASPFLHYTVRPDGENRYQIEREPHPNQNCFTLIDLPVPAEPYRERTTADYGENGLFLDRVIINKVIDSRQWRFNSADRPRHLESFVDGQRTDHAIPGDLAETIGSHFQMDVATLRAALVTTAD